jgi:hypothetical protein
MRSSWISLTVIVLASGCSTTSTGSGGGQQGRDWYTSSCADLGGSTAPSGACYVGCSPGTTCDIAASRAPSGYGVECGKNNYHPYCHVGFCNSASDCGTGWVCDYGGCVIPCTTPTSGASPECPAGLACYQNSISGHPNFCINDHSSGGTCGEPCSSGCCSPSGLTCCKPPFCSGDCAGSPCC